MGDKKYFKNKIRCKICGDIVESKFVHSYAPCSCGACFTDGGYQIPGDGARYVRRGWDPKYGDIDDVIEDIKEEIKQEEYKEYRIC